jgi:hypothetical protein
VLSSINLIDTKAICHNIKKRALFEDKLQFPVEKNTNLYSSEKHVCGTCKEEIIDISRILIMRDKDGGPRLLCYHFFFPCWDFEHLCQEYPNLIIDKAGFSFPESILIRESSINDMLTNLEFWH